MTETATEGGADGGTYSGVLGAFPYAFRQSDSRLFKLYVAVGGLVAALLTLVFGFALVVQVANTLGGPGGTFTFSRALVIVFGLFVVAPVLAPVLFVARRHRRIGSDARYDRLVAAAGFLFLASLYLGLVASIPPSFELDGVPQARQSPSQFGLFAPLIAVLYAIPSVAGPLIPIGAAMLLLGVHRTLR